MEKVFPLNFFQTEKVPHTSASYGLEKQVLLMKEYEAEAADKEFLSHYIFLPTNIPLQGEER